MNRFLGCFYKSHKQKYLLGGIPMPQCVKTLKIGSVLLKTGVFKVKKAANSSKVKKILLFAGTCKKLLNYLFGILSVPAYYFSSLSY